MKHDWRLPSFSDSLLVFRPNDHILQHKVGQLRTSQMGFCLVYELPLLKSRGCLPQFSFWLWASPTSDPQLDSYWTLWVPHFLFYCCVNICPDVLTNKALCYRSDPSSASQGRVRWTCVGCQTDQSPAPGVSNLHFCVLKASSAQQKLGVSECSGSLRSSRHVWEHSSSRRYCPRRSDPGRWSRCRTQLDAVGVCTQAAPEQMKRCQCLGSRRRCSWRCTRHQCGSPMNQRWHAPALTSQTQYSGLWWCRPVSAPAVSSSPSKRSSESDGSGNPGSRLRAV